MYWIIFLVRFYCFIFSRYLSFEPDFDPHCKSLIRRLMHPNPALRLGALQNGIADIKNHAFFSSQNIDFDKLLEQQIEMPYQPGFYNWILVTEIMLLLSLLNIFIIEIVLLLFDLSVLLSNISTGCAVFKYFSIPICFLRIRKRYISIFVTWWVGMRMRVNYLILLLLLLFLFINYCTD